MKEPTRTGYTFEGWTGTGLESLTKELTVQKGNGGERTYQANWKAIEYTITYEKTYDTAKENPIVYTIESTDIILEKPTREQYEFMGWIGTDLTEATQTVTIPTGSIGDRTYKATWETTDSIEKIFKWIEDLADTRPYQAELIDFLNTEDFSAETDEAMEQRRERLKESLEAKVKEYLIEEIAADEQLKSYKDAIQLEVAAVDKSLTSDEQRYVCEMKVLFTEDNGTEHNRTIQEYQAALTKIIPTLTLPTMNNLTYGQKVSESTVKTEGKAHYENKALQAELTVEGSFEWAEAEKTKVPYGMNNGTEKAQYTMVFTPADSENELFAAAEGKVGLLTQIGLIVSCTADSRDYDPDSAETTGTAGIWIAEEDRTAGDSVVTVEGLLKTGTYTFVNNVNQPDIVPEADKKVLYAGYELDNNKNTDEVYGSGVYVILNPDVVETKANLYKIGKDKVSISGLAATGTYEYSTLLETVKFKSGDVSYGQRKIDGTWAWNSPQTKLTVITTDSEVQKGTICFTPNDVVGYESFTEDIAITVTKKGIDVPAAVARTYTGEKQYSGLSDTDLYTVSDAGGTNAGPYTVTLTLKQVGGKDCYYWKSAEDITIDSQKGTAKVTYTIKPAEASVSGKAEEISIAYGQKLAVAGTPQSKNQMIYAKDVVTGLQVTFNNKPVTGSWEWDLTNIEVQPWNVDSSGYTVLIKFASSDKNIVVTTEKEMKVKVVSVTPDCFVKADTIYQFSSTDAPYQLSCSTLTQSLPTNPYTGEKIKGSWAWKSDQLTKTPVKDSNGNNPQYTCVFTYNSEADKTNYVELNRVIEVPVKYASESPVSYTVKIGAVTCQEGNEQFTISTVGGSVFYNEGTSTSISKRIDSAPTTTSGQTNNQQMYFILNAGYCINAIEIKASKVSANGVTNKYGLGTENKGYTWSKAFSFPCDDTNYKISLYSEDTDLTFKKPTTYYIDIQGFVAWENIEITIAVDMRGPVMPYSLEDENMTMIENNVVAEVDTVVQPESQSEIQTDQSAAPSTESQTPPLQTEPVEEPTEPSTENQTAPPQTEPQTEVTEKPTEPSTENQTSPPQTEPQTEVTEKATEASTEGQTPPPQTETEPPATEPPVTEAVTEKQSETTVPQTAAQTSQSESAAPAEDSQNLPAETVPE